MRSFTMTYSRISLLALALLAACGGSDDDGAPPTPDGPSSSGASTTFNWTIMKQGASSTCAASRATEVRVTATPEDPSRVPVEHTFQCVLAPGTLSLPPGRYAISAYLYDAMSPQVLGNASPQAVTVPATGTGPTVTFAFNVTF
jgi:hypothetical protein